MSKQRNIPKLRFKGFEGEFKQKLFDEITDITRLAGYEYSQYWKEDDKEEIIALRGYNIGKGKLDLIKLAYISNELSLQLKRSRLYKGDIVYPCVGSIGNAVVIEENDKYHIQQNIAKISCKKDVSPYFIVQFLTSDFGMNEVYRFNASGAQPNVLVGSLRKYQINIPTLPEQQKIATFLSSVDEKIQQLTRKATLLEQYKKGVMQQLFSGKLRFKDENGEEYGDWEEKKLGEVAKYYDGTHQTPNYVENGIPFYSVEHVTANQFSKSKYISEDVFEKENKRVKLEKGDILMTRIGDIGTSRLIDWDVKASFYVSLALIKQNNKYNSSFLNQYISSVNFQKELWANTIHVAFPKKINLGEIGKCKIQLPCLAEQQKIAGFLSGIDEKIGVVHGELLKMQGFKKGLLQRMFV